MSKSIWIELTMEDRKTMMREFVIEDFDLDE